MQLGAPAGKRWASVLAVTALVLAGYAAFAAGSARASLYIVSQPAITMGIKVEGQDVSIRFLTVAERCEGLAAVETNTAPVGIRRRGSHLLLRIRPPEPESTRETLRATLRRGTIVGYFSRVFRGQISCISGTRGGARVHFRATRYVPLDSALASRPKRSAPKVYFTTQGPLFDLMLRVSKGSVRDVQGRARSTCKPHIDINEPQLEVYPPFPLRGRDHHFESRIGSREPGGKSRTRLTGIVGPSATSGSYRQTYSIVVDHRTIYCRSGRPGAHGVVTYRAARYVPIHR